MLAVLVLRRGQTIVAEGRGFPCIILGVLTQDGAWLSTVEDTFYLLECWLRVCSKYVPVADERASCQTAGETLPEGG